MEIPIGILKNVTAFARFFSIRLSMLFIPISDINNYYIKIEHKVNFENRTLRKKKYNSIMFKIILCNIRAFAL